MALQAVDSSIRGTLRSITDLHLITQAAGAPQAPPQPPLGALQPPTQPNLVGTSIHILQDAYSHHSAVL